MLLVRCCAAATPVGICKSCAWRDVEPPNVDRLQKDRGGSNQRREVTMDISRWSKPELTLLAHVPIATAMVVGDILKELTKRSYSFDITFLSQTPPGGRADPDAFANAVLLETSSLVGSMSMSPRVTPAAYAARLLEQARDLLRSKATTVESTELREAVFLMCRSMLLNAGAPAQLAEKVLRDVVDDFLS